MKKFWIPALALVAMVALAGCSLRMDVSTTVVPGGDGIDQVVATVIDASEDETTDVLDGIEEGTTEKDGWTVVTTKEDKVATTRATKTIKPGDQLMPQGENDMFKDATLDLAVEEKNGVREYRAVIMIPPAPKDESSDTASPATSPTPTPASLATATPVPGSASTPSARPSSTPVAGTPVAATPAAATATPASQATPTANPTATAADKAAEEAMMDGLMDAIMQVTWTVNMPGEVVETNADEQTETGGIWRLPYEFQRKGGELRLVTRETIR